LGKDQLEKNKQLVGGRKESLFKKEEEKGKVLKLIASVGEFFRPEQSGQFKKNKVKELILHTRKRVGWVKDGSSFRGSVGRHLRARA